MRHLLIMGTIMDDITYCMNTIRSKNQILMVFCFIAVVLISAFTLWNMLIGILCEVVEAKAVGEKKKGIRKHLEDTVTEFFRAMDVDGNGHVSRSEFRQMANHPKIMLAMESLEIDHDLLHTYEQLFFGAEGEDGDDGEELTMTA